MLYITKIMIITSHMQKIIQIHPCLLSYRINKKVWRRTVAISISPTTIVGGIKIYIAKYGGSRDCMVVGFITNHWPAVSHWQTLSHNVVSSTPRLSGLELTTLAVMCTDFIGSYKSNYHTITTAPYLILLQIFPCKNQSKIMIITSHMQKIIQIYSCLLKLSRSVQSGVLPVYYSDHAAIYSILQ
jgi:hypothetical protein